MKFAFMQSMKWAVVLVVIIAFAQSQRKIRDLIVNVLMVIHW